MEQLILVAHLLIALAIIGLIMLQQGKGAEMGASFGAGASQTLFGSDGSVNMLVRVTAVLAALFFVTSFGLALIAQEEAFSVADEEVVAPSNVTVTMERSEVPAADDEAEPEASAGDDIPQVEVEGSGPSAQVVPQVRVESSDPSVQVIPQVTIESDVPPADGDADAPGAGADGADTGDAEGEGSAQ